MRLNRGEPARRWTPIAPESRAFTVLLGVLAALPALSVDLSAPTLPLLPKALATSTAVASLTLTLFMTGFALGQLSGGRLSDLRGRRPILLAGLACYTLAGVACTTAPSGLVLMIARLAQGLGAGACSVLPFATVQDLFEGEAARAKRSYVTAVFGVVPMLAPAAGVVLSDFAGWRAVHGVLALGGALLLATAILGVTESRPTSRAAPGSRARLRDDPTFVRLALVNAFSYGAIFAYIAGSPIVIIADMHLPPAIFASIFASTAAALTFGAWANGKLTRWGVRAATALGPALGLSACAGLALAAACLAGKTSGAILVPLLLLTMFARGIIAPNLQHLAIERWPEQAGVASAAVGVSQLVSGAVASAVVAVLLPDYGATAVAVPMALLAAAALLVWHRIGR